MFFFNKSRKAANRNAAQWGEEFRFLMRYLFNIPRLPITFTISTANGTPVVLKSLEKSIAVIFIPPTAFDSISYLMDL